MVTADTPVAVAAEAAAEAGKSCLIKKAEKFFFSAFFICLELSAPVRSTTAVDRSTTV